jgi:hypothetical protein
MLVLYLRECRGVSAAFRFHPLIRSHISNFKLSIERKLKFLLRFGGELELYDDYIITCEKTSGLLQ